MTRRVRTSLIVLPLLLGALWRVGHLATAQTVPAYPLDPEAFASLGASPFTSAGTYTINASQDQAAPTLSGPGIATPIQGVFFSPSGGSVARDEIAVFTFDVLTIPAGVTVQGAQNANSRPLALLSRSTATIDGTVHVSGAGGVSDRGGNAGPGGGGGGGGGEDCSSTTGQRWGGLCQRRPWATVSALPAERRQRGAGRGRQRGVRRAVKQGRGRRELRGLRFAASPTVTSP